MNSRSLDILSLLVAAERPLAAAEIARQFHISSRMVRSSLEPTEQWLRQGQITLKKVRGRGFCLLGSEQAKRNLARAIRDYDRPLPWLSRAERLQVLFINLFFAEKPVQVKQLQKALNQSRTTSLGVLDSAEEWLRDYKLELIRRPNFGCMISGDECNWRAAVVGLLQESTGDAQLLALIQGIKTVVDVSYRTKTGLQEALLKIWERLEIPLIRNLLTQIKPELEGSLSDQDYIRLVLCLAIAVYRSRIQKNIQILSEAYDHPLPAQQLSAARKIDARVQAQFGLRLTEAEVTWIALQMPEADQSLAKGPARNRLSIQNTVDEFLAQASLSLHPSLRVDEDLIRNLGVLLKEILEPLTSPRAGVARNPMLREVASKYPYIYSIARQSSSILAEQLKRELSEDEVGNIAICLIAAMERLRLLNRIAKKVMVVCSAGVVTAWLLVSRLRAEFPDVEVVEVVSALELENHRSFKGIDFVVSTVPLKIKNIPSQQVNPLLGAEDCRRLKDLFQRNSHPSPSDKLIRPATLHLSDLLTAQTVELGIAAENWQEVVEKAGAKLLDMRAVDVQFVRAMKEIILQYGPYMVMWPGVVLLHAPPDGVRQLCMGLIGLRQPVFFGHPKNDPVQAAVVLGALDNHTHLTALQELNHMMQDPEARSAILGTLQKPVILHWVARFSNSPEM